MTKIIGSGRDVELRKKLSTGGNIAIDNNVQWIKNETFDKSFWVNFFNKFLYRDGSAIELNQQEI